MTEYPPVTNTPLMGDPSLKDQDLDLRKASAASIRAKHPDRIPVIVVSTRPPRRAALRADPLGPSET